MVRPPESSARMRTRVLAAAGLATLLIGSGYAIATALDDEGGVVAGDATTDETISTGPAKPTTSPPPAVVRAPLRAVGAYDPEGDGRENDDRAPLAVDGDATTSWATERYESFFKQGVGLVLDTGRTRRLQRLDVITATPGFTAEIRAGATPTGPFTTIAGERRVDRLTQLSLGGRRGRYVVVWVTDLPDGSAAEVAEARLWVRKAR